MHTNTRRINGAAHWISFPARESDAATWQRPEKSKSNLQELRYLSSTRSLYLDLVPKITKFHDVTAQSTQVRAFLLSPIPNRCSHALFRSI